jgi:hypothetical protein
MSKDERMALFGKPNPRDESIRRIVGTAPAPPPATNGWGGGVVGGIQGLQVDDDDVGVENGGAGGGGGGKKKGKGKQLLFNISARP